MAQTHIPILFALDARSKEVKLKVFEKRERTLGGCGVSE